VREPRPAVASLLKIPNTLLAMQSRRFFEPRVPRIRFVSRRRCAIRLVAFVRALHAMSRTQAAILRVKNSLHCIQTLWRDVAAIRREQRAVFMEQLGAFEVRLLRANARKCASLPC
jgi:hypothetical protein